MKVQIVNKSAYSTPFYATEKSAGMDLKANIDEPITLGPLERSMVPTGLYIALPDGTEALPSRYEASPAPQSHPEEQYTVLWEPLTAPAVRVL